MFGSLRLLIAIAVCVLALPGRVVAAAEDVLILATTTSTENSGLLAHIHPHFENATGIKVKVIARDGNADAVLVHARAHEDKFVAEGFGLMRRDVMYNDFVVIGPQDDPARIKGAKTPAEVLNRIAAGKHVFISRGDGSGTHLKEQELWRRTALQLQSKDLAVFLKGRKKTFQSLRPAGDWYLSIGQGMGKTIIVATQKRAYTLADRGTYYAFAGPGKTDLAILCQGHQSLYNPYAVIAVNPRKHPHVNFLAAKRYIQWITSPEVQRMIGQYRLQGMVLFHPGARG